MGNISGFLDLKLYPRKIIPRILEWIRNPQIILILGSRQVGKTSCLKLVVQELVKQNVSPNRIYYFDLEDMNLLDVFNKGVEYFIKYLKEIGADLNEKNFIFIDEIQYLNNPSNFLKLISDHHSYLKLFCTGSSSLQIKMKFKDSLVGRKVVFELYPLCMSEALDFKGKGELKPFIGDFNIKTITEKSALGKDLTDIAKNGIISVCEDLMTYGGYPAVILENNVSKKTALIAEIYNTYVRKDINQLFSVENVNAFNQLIKLLSFQIGSQINLQELSSSLGISRVTVEKYLFVLEETFIIQRVPPYFSKKRKELVKMQKVFFHDLGLRNFASRNFESPDNRSDAGNVFENYVFNCLLVNKENVDSINYWRLKNGTEVDFIVDSKEVVPIEVKYSKMETSKIPSNILSFMTQYKTDKGVVVNRNLLETTQHNGHKIYFVPFYLLS